MRKYLLAIPFVFASIQASAACSSMQDVQNKGMELMTTVQQLAQKNPQAAQELSQKLMKAANDMQTLKADDYDKACTFYDNLLTEAKKGL